MDDPMLGLFDSDSTNFLDELTGSSDGLGASIGMEGGSMMGPQGPGMMETMQQQQQPQQQGGWGGMPQQQGMNPQQQKLHHFMDDYGSNQYMGDANMTRSQGNISMANSAPRMMSPSHPQQFSSPPPGGSAGTMQSPQHAQGGGYPSYSMQHGSPGVTPPRQPTPQPGQIGMNQSSGMWNQSPGSQQPSMSGSPYGILQQPAGGPRPVGPHGQTQYMSHHDYVLPPNPKHAPATPMAQQLTHFAEQQQMNSQNNYTGGHPQMGSPPPAQRLSHVAMQNPSAMGMNRHQQPMAPGMGQYPRGSQAALMQSQGSMSNFSSSQSNMCHPGYNSGNDPMGQQGQLSSGPQLNGMRFPYQGGNTPNIIQAQPGMSQGMGNVPRLSHFPQSPSHQTGPAQYQQPFPGMGGQRLSSPRPMSSPHPTPPPPSLAATGHIQSSPHMATSQGNFSQSSLQQMEQLVPQTEAMSMGVSASMSMGVSSSGYGQGRPQNAYTAASSAGVNQMGPGMMSQGFNGGQPGIGPNGPSHCNMTSMNSAGPRISTHMSSYSQGPMSQMSPMQQQQHMQQMQQQQNQQGQQPHQLNMASVPPQVQHQMNQMNREINDLQMQIQQLYNMPQNPQTQQQMLDLQERMRTLKAQQQQQIMHQQRQQQQMKQAQILQQQVKIAPAPNASMSPQLGLSVPMTQQPKQAQITVMPKQPPARMQKPGQQMMPQQQPNSQIRMPQPNNGMVAMSGSTPTTQPVASSLPHQLHQQQQTSLINLGNSPAMGSMEGTPPQVQMGTPQPQQVTPPMLTAQADVNSSQPLEPQMSSSPPELSLPDELLNTDPNSQDSDGQNSTSKEQEKANKIIAEAIAKAQAEGRDVPNVNANEESETPGKGKKKRTPKKKKEPKTPKEPKEPKEPKPKKTPAKKKSTKKKKGDGDTAGGETETCPGEDGDKATEEVEKTDAKKKEAKPKPVPRPKTVKKKKTLPTFLLKKKKKKNDSDDEEADIGHPPGSPIEDDSLLKRRSGRHVKRKKYMDEVDLQLSEEELSANKIEDAAGVGVSKPENAVDEDAMIVEKVLEMRIGKRQQYIPPEIGETVDTVVDILNDSTDIKGENSVSETTDAVADPDKAPASNTDKTTEGDLDVKPEGETEAENVEVVENCEDKLPSDKEEPLVEQLEKVSEGKSDELKGEPETCTEDGNSEAQTPAPVSTKEDEDSKENISLPKEPLKEQTKEENEIEYIEVEEFLVKYKNFSYLHCEWRTADELELGDKRVQQKLKRFKVKKAQQSSLFSQWEDEEYFNPEYVEVDRVLDVSVVKDPVSGEDVSHYLVKWRGLPYEDSTWELEADVDTSKIEQFKKFREPPPEEERVINNRPSPKDWRKMEESPVFKNDNTLREYQLEGVSWLTFSYYNKQNCILADEMGLGKTIQSITFLQQVINYGIMGPFLVIVPLSTIGNWQREFETWTDMNVIVYHGSTPSRNMLQEYEMYYKDEKGQRVPDIFKFNVLITTFEIIISDCEELCQIEWRVCIIDEAHRLKNRNCKLLEGLKMFDLEHRCLLTGTPLQNNIDELFSLLNFLEPKQFASSESFLKDFGDLKSEEQVEKLKAVLKPMMLRRLKGDVEKSLAPKEETIVEVELTNIQKKYYRAILEKNFSFLAKGSTTTNVPNLMNTMMELRKCCNHPYLINGAEEQIMIETRAQYGMDPDKQFLALINAAGKLVLIDKLLPKLKDGNHRVLVFSQMIRVLDIIEDYLIQRKYLYERIDGRIRGNLRQEAIDRFSKPDSDRFVFLLCTRAGGLGINLTAADTVIIYDSDWNPQNDLQAQARCHRIGQNKAVKVYRLLTRNTYEREMFDKASKKLGLDKAVLQSMGTKEVNNQNQLSKKEIEELLKKGAYGSLMEDDSQADQFCEEDIDSILQRRTQVIKIESGEKGSTFSKASFSTTTSRSDIAIDDPHFWEKWAKKADMDYEQLTNRNDLIIEMPRVRKQTARYGNQDQVLNMSELETSDSESELDDAGQRIKKGSKKSKKGRRKREEDGETNDGNGEYYSRSDCFKVEKNLLVYGWGRWEDILYHGRFKRKLLTTDVETLTRAILSYSLKNYAGDERIKQFIFDLISPPAEGEKKDYSNHEGLSAPVPRGRKGRKAKKDSLNNTQMVEDLAKLDIDPETILRDEGYKKHLKRHANKVLLRVRLLYYIKQEVIGDQAPKVFMSLPAYEIHIPTPYADGDPPAFWWDLEADRSMLIGVYKHGYEKYNLMRQDPCLIFLDRCGPPDSNALMAEQNDDDDVPRDDEDEEDAKPVKKRRKKKTNGDDDFELDLDEDAPTPTPSQPAPNMNQPTADGKLPFPSISDLNTRLRRVVTGYQRTHKKEIMRQEQRAKRMEKRERFEAILKEREKMKRDSQQVRWSRREEADFYRVVSTFGVERDRRTGEFIWDTFRNLARLDKKYDETLTDYFKAFYFMCKRVCKRFQSEEESIPPNSMYVEPITEERASRCLARIDLLNMIREQILWHPKLEERLKLCQSAPEMPDWWVCGEHDKDVLIGAAKHGLARTDYHILYDPKLAFREIVKEKAAAKETNPAASEEPASNEPSDLEPGEIRPSEKSLVKTELASKVEESEESALNLVKEEIKVESADIKEEDVTTNQEGGDDIQSKEEDEEEKKLDTSLIKEEEKSEEQDLATQTEVNEEVKEENTKLVDEEMVECKKEEEVEESEPKSVKMETDEKEVTEKGEEHTTDSNQENSDFKSESGVNHEGSQEEKAKLEIKPELFKEESSVAKIENLIKTELGKHYPMAGNDSDNSVVCMEEHPLAPFRKYMAGSTPGLDISLDGEERYDQLPYVDPATAEMMANSSIQWPKDRVIFYRLENVCYCIEKGEWPSQRKYIPASLSDSRSSTPVAGTPSGGTPKPGTPLGPDYTVNQNAEGLADGLKMTFQKKRKRRTKAEIEADRAARMREIMGLSVSGVSDVDSDSNISGTPISHHGVDFSPLRREEDSGHSGAERIMEMPMPKRRGRKRKIDKLMEEAQAAAAAAAAANASAGYMSLPLSGARPMAWPLAAHQLSSPSASVTQATAPPAPSPADPNGRVPVMNLEDGSRLSGDEAPKQKDLDKWLDEHPGYMVDRPDPEDEVQAELQELGLKGGRRGRRKSRIDPHKLELDQVTGEENVSVINRETGKRITGAKAPPLKYLEEWLKRNPAFDVDPKWYYIVSAKIRLPDELQPRVLKPSGRGRRPNSMLSAGTTSASSMLASDYYTSASMASLAGLSQAGLSNAGLMANYSKMAYPYAGMTGMGLNSLYAAQLAQYGLLSGMRKPGEDPGQEVGEVRKDEEGNPKEEEATSPSSKSGVTPTMHPSFPYMYNPLLFNQLYAQSLAAAAGSFQLPASMSASFASLAAAQQSMMNGMGVRGESDEDPESKPTAKEQDAAEDLSVRSSSSKSGSRSQDRGTDLSVKKRKREHRSGESPTDLSMKVSNSSSVSLDLSMKKAETESSSSLDLSAKDKDLPKISLERTPEKSKHSMMPKHKSPKALMDVIKELKSNKQKASKSKPPVTPSKEEGDLKVSPIKDDRDILEQEHKESPVQESEDVV